MIRTDAPQHFDFYTGDDPTLLVPRRRRRRARAGTAGPRRQTVEAPDGVRELRACSTGSTGVGRGWSSSSSIGSMLSRARAGRALHRSV